jgi:hypothetical protein
MNRNEIKDLIMVILDQADYDLMKSYDPEIAEEPDNAEANMERLIDTVENHFNPKPKKTRKKK